MKLVIGLFKSAPVGLVPVKKQVSKKGKVFTQTFYVKPEDAPKAKKKPKQETAPSDKESKSSEPVVTNRGDGFYAAFDEGYYKIPQSDISQKFSYKGFEWVVFHEMDGSSPSPYLNTANFKCVEVSTGRAGGQSGKTPEEAIHNLKAITEGMSEEHIAKVVSSHPKVKEVDESRINSKELKVVDKLKKITNFKPFAKQILLNVENKDAISLEDMMAWMKKHVQTEASFTVASNEIDDLGILKEAVEGDYDYETAKDRREAIDYAVKAVKESDNFGASDITKEDILKWGKEYEDDFVDGVSYIEVDPVYNNDGDEMYSSADILAYAVKNNKEVSDAKKMFQEQVDEEDRENQEEMTLTSMVYHGSSWDREDLESVSNWVNGTVSSNRNMAKSLFAKLESGQDSEYIRNEYAGSLIVRALEKGVAWDFSDGALYRGTQNPDVKHSNVGDVIPLGMASFTKSESRSRGFTTNNGGTIFVLSPEYVKEQVKGIDIDGMIEQGRDEGYDHGSMLGMDAYSEEKEFIVVAPALKLVKKLEEDGKTFLYVEPTKMELLDMLKSKFSSNEERIAAIEAAFDVPIHDDYAAVNKDGEGEKKE